MSFKFFVGHAVEYTPVGEKTAGLYKIVRQMPEKPLERPAECSFRRSRQLPPRKKLTRC
jgi:hypothetical protein